MHKRKLRTILKDYKIITTTDGFEYCIKTKGGSDELNINT